VKHSLGPREEKPDMMIELKCLERRTAERIENMPKYQGGQALCALRRQRISI